MLTWGSGGVHKNLTFADGGVQNGQKNADVINERPLTTPQMTVVGAVRENTKNYLKQSLLWALTWLLGCWPAWGLAGEGWVA